MNDIVRGRVLPAVVFLAAAVAWAVPALAYGPNLVQNGDFETTNMGSGSSFAPAQIGASNVSNWSTSGYNFIFGQSTAATVGSNSVNYGTIYMSGTNYVAQTPNGIASGSPTGGNFVGADGAYQVGAITQTITGLQVGASYAVSFYWAGAQQSGYSSPFTSSWSVSLGSQTQSTKSVAVQAGGFSGWMYTTMQYVATATSEVLSFLSAGTPTGQPPFALLDGVTAQQVPEPSSAAAFAAAVAAVAVVARRRRRLA